MASTVAGIVVILALGAWHLRIRRHPNWRHSRDGRFYIGIGYPFVVVAVFFLVNATTNTDPTWLAGMAWAVLAVTLFVYGFQALDGDDEQTPAAAATRPTTLDLARASAAEAPPKRGVTRPDVDA